MGKGTTTKMVKTEEGEWGGGGRGLRKWTWTWRGKGNRGRGPLKEANMDRRENSMSSELTSEGEIHGRKTQLSK
jgi:hypothetical protein